MKTQVYFYSFDTRSKPGVIICQGVRFESVEIKAEGFDETMFKILCDHHPELRGIPLAAFKQAVTQNFR